MSTTREKLEARIEEFSGSVDEALAIARQVIAEVGDLPVEAEALLGAAIVNGTPGEFHLAADELRLQHFNGDPPDREGTAL